MERRTFLVLSAAAVGLAGCTRGSVEPSPPSQPAPSTAPADPDSRLRDEVAASEVALIAAYRLAIEADPDLAADLEPLVAHHEAHLARVAPAYAAGSGVGPVPRAPSGPSGGPGAPNGSPSATAESPNGSPSATAEVPTAERARSVLVGLAEAESAAQAQRASACDGAQDPALARDLCLIAASEAQHAAFLQDLAEAEPPT